MVAGIITTKKGNFFLSSWTPKNQNDRHRLENLIKNICSKEHSAMHHPFWIELDGTPHILMLHRKCWPLRIWKLYPGESLMPGILRKIIDRYPGLACMTDQRGKLICMNDSLSYILGTTKQQPFKGCFQDLFVQAPNSETMYAKAHTMKTSSGYPVHVTVNRVLDYGGCVAIFMGVHDLPDALPGAAKIGVVCGTRVLDHMPLPAALLDESGGMCQYNQPLVPFLPSRKSLPLAQWISEKDRYSFAQHLRRLKKSINGPVQMSLRLKVAEHIPFLIFLKYIRSHTEEVSGQFLVVFVMQEHLMSKEADPQKMQILGQLASGIVHDFNNLLTGILGFCDLLLERHGPEEATYKDVQQIKHSANGAARLIQQLLAFSKASTPCQESVCVYTCLQELLPLIHRMVGPKIVLNVDSASECMVLCTQADRNQIEQILLNLSINARDAMSSGGMLTFSLSSVHFKQKKPVMRGMLLAGRYLVLDIQDTGTGVPSEHVDRIFDPFFSTKIPGQGTGLGLSNVLQLMQSFQGGLTIDTKMGQGTTFSLYFPQQGSLAVHQNASEQALERPPVEPPHPASFTARPFVALEGVQNESNTPLKRPLDQAPFSQKHQNQKDNTPFSQEMGKKEPQLIRVLLVEDEDPVRLFAARALRTKGHDVTEARDGMHAREYIGQTKNFDVLVTDVMMPGIDGPSLATMVRQKWPEIKIIFVSGYPEEEVRRLLSPEMQDVFFLPKPFALGDLVSKIQMVYEAA